MEAELVAGPEADLAARAGGQVVCVHVAIDRCVVTVAAAHLADGERTGVPVVAQGTGFVRRSSI